MRTSITFSLLASAALLAGCNTVRGVGSDVASVAAAFDPNATYATCGSYGPIDRNGDGRISNSEWNDYRAGGYSSWDANHDGRISRAEYANCWYGGGFYSKYNRATWEPSYSVFDTNHDGYLSADEYWNAQAYGAYDRNHDGVIDSSEWPW
jgi:predicted small secreted protein